MIHFVAIHSKLVWSNTVTHTKEQVIPLTHSSFGMTITVDNEINAFLVTVIHIMMRLPIIVIDMKKNYELLVKPSSFINNSI